MQAAADTVIRNTVDADMLLQHYYSIFYYGQFGFASRPIAGASVPRLLGILDSFLHHRLLRDLMMMELGQMSGHLPSCI